MHDNNINNSVEIFNNIKKRRFLVIKTRSEEHGKEIMTAIKNSVYTFEFDYSDIESFDYGRSIMIDTDLDMNIHPRAFTCAYSNAHDEQLITPDELYSIINSKPTKPTKSSKRPTTNVIQERVIMYSDSQTKYGAKHMNFNGDEKLTLEEADEKLKLLRRDIRRYKKFLAE